MIFFNKRFCLQTNRFQSFLLKRLDKIPIAAENLKCYKNIFWLLFHWTLPLLGMLVVGTAVIRYLGREQYGALSYVVSMLAISFPLATLGIEGVVYRELVLGRHPQGKILGTAALLRFFGGLLASSCLLMFSFLYAHEPTTQALLIIVSLIPVIRAGDVLDSFFQSRAESKRVVLIQAIGQFLSYLARGALLINHASLIWFGATIVLEWVLITGPFIYVYNKTPSRDTHWHFDRSIAGAMLLESWPGFLCLLLWQLGGKIDQILVKNILGNNELGVYAAATILVEGFDFIPCIIGGSLFSQLILAKEERVKYCHSLGRLFELTLTVSLILIIVYSIAAPLIIHSFYGSRFEGAIGILPVYVFKSAFLFLAYIRGRWLIIENLQLRDLGYRAGTFLFNVVLCLFWIPWLGIQGAALASVVSCAIGLYLIPLLDPRLKDVNQALHQAIRFPILRGVLRGVFL